VDFGFSGVLLWKVRECRMNCGFCSREQAMN
jgi:L-lysine 2,3-aminomutase